MERRYTDASPEDIVQDVALSLLDKLNVDVQIENLAGYIYRSLRNRVFDNQKKARNTLSMDSYSDSNEMKLVTDAETDNDLAFRDINPSALHSAIEQLSNDDKYLIKEIHFGQKSFKQLSTELNTPIGTLLSRKHRAQEKLAKILTTKTNKNL
jgi:RNA polymerase sigma-70 factor (ECF subfamily)